MANNQDRYFSTLRAEIVANEGYADVLVEYAASLRVTGHDNAAAKLVGLSRRYRVTVLGLQGKLAAAAAQVE